MKLVNSKQASTIVVTEKDLESDEGSGPSEVNKIKWKTVFKIKAPWFGMGALLAVICFSIGQFLVLYFADNTTSTHWKFVSPNVCLSMLNSASNLLVAFAIGNGIAIAWWRKATHSQTTVKRLQKSWAFSNSSLSLLKNIQHLNIIALTAMMAKVAVVDGILFQKAMGTNMKVSWNTTGPPSDKILAFSQTTLPITGYMPPVGMTDAQTEYNYSIAVTNWLNVGSGLNDRNYVDCDGVGCVYGLNGAGFVVDCNTTNVTDTFVDTASTSGYNSKTIFSVDWYWKYQDVNNNYSSIIMNATWPAENDDDSTCPTIFTNSLCEFRPAKLNYTVAYTNFASVEKSKLKDSQSDYWESTEQEGSWGSELHYSCATPASAFTWIYLNDTTEDCRQYNAEHRQLVGVDVIDVQDIYEPNVASTPSRLAGIFNALKDQFTSRATLTYSNGNWSVAQSGALAPIAEGPIPLNASWCNYTYVDPTSRIVRRLNTLMLQTSVSTDLYPESATESEDSDEIPAYKYYKEIYYAIDYKYSGVALGLTFIVIACILPSYWEFWTLGREVTLEPFEIADSLKDLILTDAYRGRGDVNEVTRPVDGRTMQPQGWRS